MTATVAAVAALAAAAAGCEVKTTSGQVDATHLVNKSLRAQNLDAKSISCPDSFDDTVGSTFECNVTLQNGKDQTYAIRVESSDRIQVVRVKNGGS